MTSPDQVRASDAAGDAGPPHRRRRVVRPTAVGLAAAVLVAWVGGNTYAAVVLSRGGQDPVESRDPSSLGLEYRDVTYGKGRPAWYVAGEPGRPVVVVVHGYGNNRTAALGVGPPLHELGYGLLFVNLGYVSGARRYGGGGPEGRDVADAARWARATLDVPVVLVGFSAGALASLAATAEGAPVAAVVADSGFAGFREVVAFRAGVSRPFTSLLPVVYRLASGGGRIIDLATAIGPGPFPVPTLVIQGDADRTVPPSSGRRVAALTGGRLWQLPGVGHTGAFHADEAGWVKRVDDLVRSAVPAQS